MHPLLVIKQRLAFTIFGTNGSTSVLSNLTEASGNADNEGSHKENCHDGECKDPLDTESFKVELSNTKA